MVGGSLESFVDLPDDVIIHILAFCDLQTLGRLARTCKQLSRTINGDCIWRSRLRALPRVKAYISNANAQLANKQSAREHYRIAQNWTSGTYKEQRLVHHGIKQMPWMQLEGNQLWVSNKNTISAYGLKLDGRLVAVPLRHLTGHNDDVARFISKDDFVVAGTREGDISVFRHNMDQPYKYMRDCHSGDVHSVDMLGDIIVSGSRDTTIKVWSISSGRDGGVPLRTIAARDRVWSVAMNPNGGTFVSGSAGLKQIPPLRLWDIERGELLGNLGANYKNGAGVLDMQFETPSMLLTGGYDTIVRCWDLRAPQHKCVMRWEEPFDSAIYCLKSDGRHCLLVGTARHGMVRLWDKRRPRHVQQYYIGKTNSPVYSLAYDSSHLYVGLDKGIYLVDFGSKR